MAAFVGLDLYIGAIADVFCEYWIALPIGSTIFEFYHEKVQDKQPDASHGSFFWHHDHWRRDLSGSTLLPDMLMLLERNKNDKTNMTKLLSNLKVHASVKPENSTALFSADGLNPGPGMITNYPPEKDSKNGSLYTGDVAFSVTTTDNRRIHDLYGKWYGLAEEPNQAKVNAAQKAMTPLFASSPPTSEQTKEDGETKLSPEQLWTMIPMILGQAVLDGNMRLPLTV